MRILDGHEGPVRCLGYSPDGRFIASGGDDKWVLLWDAAGGELSAILEPGEGVEAMAFAPDSNRIAVGASDGGVSVWDVAEGRMLFRANGHGRKPGDLGDPDRGLREDDNKRGVRGLAYSPDGAWLISSGWDGTVKTWRRGSSEPDALEQDVPPVLGLAFSPDGTTLAGAGVDGSVRLYDFAARRLLRTLPGPSPCYTLTFADDGRLAAGDAGGGVTVWSREGEALRTWSASERPVYALAFTPDARSLLTAGVDGVVRLWDADGGRERLAYRWHASWVLCLAVAPDGLTAAAGGADNTIAVWDLDAG